MAFLASALWSRAGGSASTRRRLIRSAVRMSSETAPTSAPKLTVKMGLQSVQARMERAARERDGSADREGPATRLVAVSKTKPVEMLMEAYECGQRHFGENYVQELVTKAESMPEDINWHYIGPLQSNKAKLIASVKNLWCIETVDRQKIADALNRAAEGRPKPLQVMIQVDVSQEETKSGVDEAEAPVLAKHIVTDCPSLKLIGLMTIGRPDSSPEPEAFKRLATVRSNVARELGVAPESLELSMGMSGDFEAAVRMGSTSIRVGSTIFGARHYPNKTNAQ